MPTKSTLYQADYLHAITRTFLEVVGTSHHIADTVAKIMVKANLTGHDSHGVLRIPKYLKQIEAGQIKPDAEPTIVKETANILLVDGHLGFGHYIAHQAMQWAIQKAKTADICCVSFKNTGHMGRLGEYAEMAAEEGCISFITVGRAGVPGCSVIPFGGAKGALWPNPLTYGVPSGDEAPFIFDMATSVLSGGNLEVARSNGTPLPEGAIVDNQGQLSVNVEDFFNGGFLQPFGGYKGTGLGILTTLFGGLSNSFDPEQGIMQGEFMQVINIESFLPPDTYYEGVQAGLNTIRATPPAPGFDEVLIPGDKARRTSAQRSQKGIPIPESIWQELCDCADKLDIDLDQISS